MSARRPEPEVVFEAGLAAALALLLVGVGMLLYGGVVGGVGRGRREREALPARGSVPAERHQHTAVASAR